MAPHSSTLAWQIPWMEEPGRLQSMESQRVRHNWATSLSLFTFMHWRRKWQPTPVFFPGESQGQSLVGCHLWGRTESATTEAAAAAAEINYGMGLIKPNKIILLCWYSFCVPHPPPNPMLFFWLLLSHKERLMIFVYEMVQEYQKDIKRRNFLLYQQTKRSIGLGI